MKRWERKIKTEKERDIQRENHTKTKRKGKRMRMSWIKNGWCKGNMKIRPIFLYILHYILAARGEKRFFEREYIVIYALFEILHECKSSVPQNLIPD